MKTTKRRRERGSVTVELGGIFPLIGIIILMCFDALLVATTVERVENAARTGARAASQAQDLSPATCMSRAGEAMPSWINGTPEITGRPVGVSGVSCRVKAKIPLIWKNVPYLEIEIDRNVSMPMG
jgi:hypothetical protein